MTITYSRIVVIVAGFVRTVIGCCRWCFALLLQINCQQLSSDCLFVLLLLLLIACRCCRCCLFWDYNKNKKQNKIKVALNLSGCGKMMWCTLSLSSLVHGNVVHVFCSNPAFASLHLTLVFQNKKNFHSELELELEGTKWSHAKACHAFIFDLTTSEINLKALQKRKADAG